ncbi:MAG TPA: hypothetical protein VFA52_01760 [Candidatus Paceibacterota bacterium]|nr:hypothetical protein [Candidatus Paceibacterota bacterium]
MNKKLQLIKLIGQKLLGVNPAYVDYLISAYNIQFDLQSKILYGGSRKSENMAGFTVLSADWCIFEDHKENVIHEIFHLAFFDNGFFGVNQSMTIEELEMLEAQLQQATEKFVETHGLFCDELVKRIVNARP